jgi:hypothetical protein
MLKPRLLLNKIEIHVLVILESELKPMEFFLINLGIISRRYARKYK